MDRRDFIIRSAISSLIASFPSVFLSRQTLIIKPTGADDSMVINTTLRASARVGIPALLAEGVFTVTETIIVPVGARIIGQGKLSKIKFSTEAAHEVIRIDEPHLKHPVKKLFIENRNSPVPFIAIIG